MLRYGLAIGVLGAALLSPVAGGQETTRQQPDQREPSSRITSFQLKARLTQVERQKSVRDIRETLWDCWHRRLLCEVWVTDDQEAARTQTIYAVKQETDSLWRVSVHIKSVVTDPWYPREKYHDELTYRIYTVERVGNLVDTTHRQRRVPPDASLSGDAYHLLLLDKDGKIVQNL